MKRFGYLLAITLSVFAVNSLSAQQETPAEKNDIRIRKIRQVTALMYLFSDGEKPFPTGRFTILYDRRGNRVKFTSYVYTGTIAEVDTYVYDDHDNVIEATSGSGTGTNRSQEVSYDYDRRGHVIAMRLFKDGSLQSSGTFTPNAQGSKNTREVEYDANGKVTVRREFKLDTAGERVMEQAEYDASGKLPLRKVHTYNNKGNATQTVVSGPEDRPLSKTVYQYESDEEHLRETIEYNAQGKLATRTVLKRDSDGFVIENLRSDSGKPTELLKFSYEFYR